MSWQINHRGECFGGHFLQVIGKYVLYTFSWKMLQHGSLEAVWFAHSVPKISACYLPYAPAPSIEIQQLELRRSQYWLNRAMLGAMESVDGCTMYTQSYSEVISSIESGGGQTLVGQQLILLLRNVYQMPFFHRILKSLYPSTCMPYLMTYSLNKSFFSHLLKEPQGYFNTQITVTILPKKHPSPLPFVLSFITAEVLTHLPTVQCSYDLYYRGDDGVSVVVNSKTDSSTLQHPPFPSSSPNHNLTLLHTPLPSNSSTPSFIDSTAHIEAARLSCCYLVQHATAASYCYLSICNASCTAFLRIDNVLVTLTRLGVLCLISVRAVMRMRV